MNGRHFLGAVAGSLATSKVKSMEALAITPEKPADNAPRPAWIENGLVNAGGSHEPYLFVQRRGGQPLNYREIYAQAQSEDVIRLLKSQGVDTFHTHFYKGFGMAAEMPEMQDTV